MQKIYILDIREITKKHERVLNILPLNAIKKAAEFKEERDKLRSLGGALLVEAFTAKSPLLFSKYGKPYKKEPPFFNVSHSGDKAGIFVSDCKDVGFDLQEIKPHSDKLENYIFSDEERNFIKDDSCFIRLWTMKEAAAKCLGIGISGIRHQHLKDITDGTFTFEHEKLYYKNYFDGEYAITACSYKAINADILNIDLDFIFKTLAKRDKDII